MLPVLKLLIPIVSKFFDDDWNFQNEWSQYHISIHHSNPPSSKLSFSQLLSCLDPRSLTRLHLRWLN